MKVSELREIIKDLPDDTEIVVEHPGLHDSMTQQEVEVRVCPYVDKKTGLYASENNFQHCGKWKTHKKAKVPVLRIA